MQTPSASDPSFKAFLEKLQEQNSRGFLTQLAQLKSERETAGEDADKREEQLDQANENLKDLKDETSSTKDSLREGLHDLSDDTIEVQDQLDAANDSLSEIATAIIGAKESIEVEMLVALEAVREAVTGIKLDVDFSELKDAITEVSSILENGHQVSVMSAIGANTTKLLDEQIKELSLVRKLSEGSVEYDKEAAQYRNTSGRDIESKVSGKTSKSGGFIDFETARDTLSGQGERAKKDNKVNLVTSITTTRPGKAASEALGANLGSSTPVEVAEPVSKTPEVVPGESIEKTPEVTPSRNTSIKRARRERGSVTGDVDPKEKNKEEELDTSFLGRVKDSAKFWLTDGLSEKPGTGMFQKPSKEVEKKDREAKVSSPRQENPEADNITSTGEIQADTAKSDLELSKQMLDTTREQLTELKAIREALAPSTPKDLVEQKSAPSATSEKESGEGSGSSLIGDLAGAAGNLLGGGKGKAASKAAGMGGKILGGLGKAAKFLGPAAAIAGAAYSGFEGYQNTNENFNIKEGEEATTGQKISSTLGGVVSGATLGLLDGKTASQGIHKAGEFIGDTASKAGSAVKDFFGFGDKKKSEAVSPSTTTSSTTTSTTSESKTRIAGEDVGEKLSDKQMAVMEMSKASGNKYSPEIEAMYSKQKEAAITPSTASTPGATVAQTSTENADMAREASSKPAGGGGTIVSNNVSSNNTTKIVPMKANPRPEYTGSALDRYTNRITVY